jgi:hypothetical protein
MMYKRRENGYQPVGCPSRAWLQYIGLIPLSARHIETSSLPSFCCKLAESIEVTTGVDLIRVYIWALEAVEMLVRYQCGTSIALYLLSKQVKTVF